eukprot:TRINITY_DN1377_c0_g1_i1.p1 TRINITY_DN1377_c0_g1~~TRINITY_DN1377_c0_g1_i1.p1  ORF type:complete len:535 (+),score=233.44 TRINITY_DN1377_c0_g1_i1:70-1674(+)
MAEVYSFSIPNSNEEYSGWGPNSVPEQYKEVPYYAPYSKGDKLGRVAELYQSNQNRGQNRFNKDKDSSSNNLFSWTFEDDDSSFQVVDNSKTPVRRNFGRNRGFQNRGNFQQMRSMHQHGFQQYGAPRGKQQKKQGGFRGSYFNRSRYDHSGNGGNIRRRDPTVEVKPTWKEISVFEFSQLAKVSTEEPKAEDLVSAGELLTYNKGYNSVSLKAEKPIEPTESAFYQVTTSDDPIIRELAAEEQGNVYATDVILTHLMTLTKSVFPWDVIVHKVDNNIFFDKRNSSTLDLFTVSETADNAPPEDSTSINSAGALSEEATHVNKSFSQQILSGEAKKMERPNPFHSSEEKAAPVAYKYRKWQLGDGIQLVARVEVDAVSTFEGKEVSLTVKAVNEYDPKTGLDWRKKLDVQRGAIITTEYRNNSFKMAKWTVQSHLAGTDFIKLGYITRSNAKDNTSHSLLTVQDFSPKDFAVQTATNMKNAWGIIKNLIMIFQAQQNGKYIILRDLERNAIRIYSVPDNAFDEVAKEEVEEEDN